MGNNKFTKTLNNIYIKNYGLTAFLLGLLISSLLFIPIIIQNGGVFMYYGDFNVQEIPFYQMMHDAVLSGNTNWSSTTDLGSATIASYSFYLMGSPFFFLTLLFPSEAVPFLIGPIFMLKFAFCSLSAYLYLKRYVKNKTFAVAGGLLYAFSGFSIYNIFFFHFHEPMIIFPLLLLAVDEMMYNNRKGVVATAVFAACTVNYYFFAGMAVFTAIYWFMLVFTNNYKLTLSKLLLFVFEVLLGFFATAFIVLPTVLFLNGNPRLSVLPDGYNALVYENPQKYWYIILSFFFPPELAAEPNFTPNVDANWASVSGWLPLVGMTGVIGYLQLKRRDWIKKLLLLLIVFALVPIFNSVFQLLNASIFYARWYYMLVLIMCLATIKSLENKEVNWKRALCWSGTITAAIAILIGLMPQSIYDGDVFEYTKTGLADNLPRYWIYVAISVLSLFLFAIIIKKFKTSSRKLSVSLVAGICLITLVSSTYIVETGTRMDGDDNAYIRQNLIGAADSVKLDDIKNVRSDFYESVDNAAMYLNIPSIQAFHSVVTPSIMNFYDSLGYSRDVASEPDTNSYGLRGLLSCKYLFCDNTEKFEDKKGNTKMPGWSYLKDIDGFKIYKNDYFVPMGFTYDSFITESEFKEIDTRYKSEAILKAMILDDEDILKFQKLTGYSKNDIETINKDKSAKDNDKKFESKTENFSYGKEYYFEDCKKLSGNTCSNFEYNNEGFKATINNKGEENLLFFSVPYTEGWSAYVNGKEAEIIKSNIGFMSVLVEGNKKSEVVFKYNPPGFRTGIIITVVCGTIFLMYISVLILLRNSRRKKRSKI
ncbi:MAG: YfhO family protein [Ruminococcus sp.]|nr:YfhO family protein [Ruminococcus sp.]